MYRREFEQQILSFEPSGGLINASLVMQDRETDSYWSIITNQSISGEYSGTSLKEIPIAVKMKWKDWKQLYPNSEVLSVDGLEDTSPGYVNYFDSNEGFRGLQSKDKRFADKELIFIFKLGEKEYAVQASRVEGGKVFTIGASNIFIYRPQAANSLFSTVAYQLQNENLLFENNLWYSEQKDCVFDGKSLLFDGEDQNCPERLKGYDTFWYTLSLTHSEFEVLE